MKLDLLVATNGGPAAMGALRLALGMTRKRGSTVEVLSVLEPPPPPRLTGFQSLPFDYPTPEIANIHSLYDAVSDQLEELGSEATIWPLIVDYGSPGPVIARVARDRDAGLILLGLSSHTRLERFRIEAALDVLHVAHAPVLAARQDVADLPRSVLIAIDFSEVSLRALRTVLPFVQDGGVVHLAHIAPDGSEARRSQAFDPWVRDPGFGLRALARKVASESNLSVEIHSLSGDPQAILLEFAERFRIDLIASGSHEYGHLEQVFVRSLSTALLRDAPCSVLVVPPSNVPAKGSRPRGILTGQENLDRAPAADGIPLISRSESTEPYPRDRRVIVAITQSIEPR